MIILTDKIVNDMYNKLWEEEPLFRAMVGFARQQYEQLEQELIEKVAEILQEFSNKHQNIGEPVDTELYAKHIVKIFRGVELI